MVLQRPYYFQGQQKSDAPPLRRYLAQPKPDYRSIRPSRNKVQIASTERRRAITEEAYRPDKKHSPLASRERSPRRPIRRSASPPFGISPRRIANRRSQAKRFASLAFKQNQQKPLLVDGPVSTARPNVRRDDVPARVYRKQEKWIEIATGLEIKKPLWLTDSSTSDSMQNESSSSEDMARSSYRNIPRRSIAAFESQEADVGRYYGTPRRGRSTNYMLEEGSTIVSDYPRRLRRRPIAAPRVQRPRSYCSGSYSPSVDRVPTYLRRETTSDYGPDVDYYSADETSSGYNSTARFLNVRNGEGRRPYNRRSRQCRSPACRCSPTYHQSPAHHHSPARMPGVVSRRNCGAFSPVQLVHPVSRGYMADQKLKLDDPRPDLSFFAEPLMLRTPERCRANECSRVVQTWKPECEECADADRYDNDSIGDQMGCCRQHRNRYRSPHEHHMHNSFDQWLTNAAEGNVSPTPGRRIRSGHKYFH